MSERKRSAGTSLASSQFSIDDLIDSEQDNGHRLHLTGGWMNAKTDTGSRVAGGPRGGECRAQQYAGGTHRLYGGGLDRGKSSGQLDIPFHNPESCALADGYIIYATLPGAQLLDSVALSAQSQAKAVVLTIDGCIFDRPKVIGVSTAP